MHGAPNSALLPLLAFPKFTLLGQGHKVNIIQFVAGSFVVWLLPSHNTGGSEHNPINKTPDGGLNSNEGEARENSRWRTEFEE